MKYQHFLGSKVLESCDCGAQFLLSHRKLSGYLKILLKIFYCETLNPNLDFPESPRDGVPLTTLQERVCDTAREKDKFSHS